MKKKQLSPKQTLIAQMIEMYDIKDAKDILHMNEVTMKIAEMERKQKNSVHIVGNLK